ncbi:MAG: hypothetical protein ACLP8S_27790 [Solirubrobacteraceae bacterium]
MSLKRINTISNDQAACDVCGRTLLRGEHAESFVNGNERRHVCQLCISRALHEGWVREGALQAQESGSSGSERRRSILGRLRPRREPSDPTPAPDEDPPVSPRPKHDLSSTLARGRSRETRHVRAVPASVEQKIVSAMGLFSASEHRRTVSGVARSLGSPVVNVTPDEMHPSLVRIIASWELCWYRYEVDISDEVAGVRLIDQGYELTDLSEAERHANAAADEVGQLSLLPDSAL